MAGHVFSEIYLHFNWHTEANYPYLNPTVEPFVHRYLAHKCTQEKGVFFEEVGGTEDHIHLVVRVEPTVSPSEFVHSIKGSCSHDTNEHFKKKVLDWQRGYGVVSFGKRHLPWVREYVRNQKLHHARGAIHGRLEMIREEDGDRAKEDEGDYPI